ncbi:MAG: hypothetical protein Q4B43_09885 [Bacteroidota bacterium]|nr:hypothetical protein [Bacteroidota bacterium]
MITKIFSKTNFTLFSITAIFSIMALVFYWYNNYYLSNSLSFSAIFANSIFTIMALYMTQKIAFTDHINAKNSFSILFFSIFILFIPSVFADSYTLIANIFVLLGMDRLINLHTLSLSKEKILDASIAFSIACIFEFWTILFFLLIFISLLFYILNNIRYWIIPLIGATAVAIILALYIYIFDSNIGNYIIECMLLYPNFQEFNLNITSFNVIYLSMCTVILMLFQITTLKKHLQSTQISLKILLSSIFISLIIFILTQLQNNLIFLITPLALLMSNLVYSIEKKWIRETITYLFIGFGIIYFFLIK